MICSRCGVDGAGAFCTSCGNALTAQAPTSPPPPVQTQYQAPASFPAPTPAPTSYQPPPATTYSGYQNPYPTTGYAPAPRRNRGWIVAASVIGGLLLLGAIGVFASGAGMVGPTVLEAAVQECDAVDELGVLLDEDGRGLFLDGDGEEDYGVSYTMASCILEALNMPSSVSGRIVTTSALMGVQEADWDGIAASWTYHPDDGLDMSLELQE